MATVEVFTPWELANATNQGFPPREPVVQYHTTRYNPQKQKLSGGSSEFFKSEPESSRTTELTLRKCFSQCLLRGRSSSNQLLAVDLHQISKLKDFTTNRGPYVLLFLISQGPRCPFTSYGSACPYPRPHTHPPPLTRAPLISYHRGSLPQGLEAPPTR